MSVRRNNNVVNNKTNINKNNNSNTSVESNINALLKDMDSNLYRNRAVYKYSLTFHDSYSNNNKRNLLPIDYKFIDTIVQKLRGNKDALKQLWVEFLDLPYKTVDALLVALINSNDANIDLSFMLAEFTGKKYCDRNDECDPLVLEIAGKLMLHGADIMKPYNLRNLGKCSSLEAACRNAHEPLIHLYVDSIDANAANYNSILDECLFNVLDTEITEINPPYLQICKYLVSKGARPDRHIPKFNGNALGIAREVKKYGRQYGAAVVKYLESVVRPPQTKKNTLQLSDLPIRNVLAKHLNTRSTRALMATSKSVAKELAGDSDANEFANNIINRAERKAILGKEGDEDPYDQGCAVVFCISDRQVVDKLGFCGIQYIFAPVGSDGFMRLLDMHVISDEMMTTGSRLWRSIGNLDDILFYYVLLHRAITTTEFTPLKDHSNKSTVTTFARSFGNRGLNEALMPNQKEISRRFRSADPLYKQLFMVGYYQAVKIAQEALYEAFDEDGVEDGDAIGDIMDMLAKSPANNTNNLRPNYELQHIKRKARAQVLGEYNSKLKAPFSTAQAIKVFTPSQNRPKGEAITQLTRAKAALLLQQAQARTANAEKSYYEKSGGDKPKKEKKATITVKQK